MNEQTKKRGAPFGNTNALKHGKRTGAARAAATERNNFYRWCRKTLAQINNEVGHV